MPDSAIGAEINQFISLGLAHTPFYKFLYIEHFCARTSVNGRMAQRKRSAFTILCNCSGTAKVASSNLALIIQNGKFFSFSF